MNLESTQTVSIAARSPSVLEVHEDGRARSFALGHAPLRIGSAAHADVRIADPTVSAHHADIVWDGSAHWIVDADSKNGTHAGGARVPKARLLLGAVICIGNAVLMGGRDSQPPAAIGPQLPGMAGTSARMLELATSVRRLAQTAHPVLIVGETGTGKELIARALHTEGPRGPKPFVPLNVANLPRDLVEAELFGVERGAYTGAVASRLGAFAEAHKGTLFLDEIGELPREAQPKLLRVLDGYGMRRLGAEGPAASPDVRVVTATHAPLQAAVQRGDFRRDLFHRLEVHVVQVPALRERRGDIPAIARALLRSFDVRDSPRLTASAIAQLVHHAWPGNVRELRNVLYRAASDARTPGTIRADDVLRALSAYAPARPELSPEAAERCLREYGDNLSRAARAAGVPRTTFRRRLEAALKGG